MKLALFGFISFLTGLVLTIFCFFFFVKPILYIGAFLILAGVVSVAMCAEDDYIKVITHKYK